MTPDGDPRNPVFSRTPDGDPRNPVFSMTPDGDPRNPVFSMTPDGDPRNPVFSRTPDGDPREWKNPQFLLNDSYTFCFSSAPFALLPISIQPHRVMLKFKL